MVDEAERQKNKDGKAKTSTPTPALWDWKETERISKLSKQEHIMSKPVFMWVDIMNCETIYFHI